jgi:sugar lactone lactonase YvrE
MPELEQQLRAYFDVLADHVEDNVKDRHSRSPVNGLDHRHTAVSPQQFFQPAQRPVHDAAVADLRGADETAEPEHRNRRFIAAVAAAAAVAIVVVTGLVVLDGNRDLVVSDFVGGDVEIEVFLDDLSEVVDVDFDPSGRLFVMEHLEGLSTIEIRADGSAGGQVFIAQQMPNEPQADDSAEPDEGVFHGTDLEAMTLDENGALYFADSQSVYQITDLPVGNTTEFISATPGRDQYDAEGLAIDDNRDLYVAASTESGVLVTRVEVLDDGSAGTVTEIVTVPRGGAHGDIEFGPAGELFVTTSTDEIWAITFADDGSMTSLRVSATIPGGPGALASDASGRLYVGTRSGTLWSVDPAGDPIAVATGFDHVAGLTFDASGNLYLADWGTGEILRITTK